MSVIHQYRDQVSEFLDEFRTTERKNEIVSREYIIALLIEKHPHLGKVSKTALKSMVTVLVEEKGGKRLKKANSKHLKYFWPIPVEEGVKNA